MPTNKINHAAAWVAAIVFYVWGYIWFSLLFKNQVSSILSGMNASQVSNSPIVYAVGFLLALVVGYGFAIALADSSNPSAAHGISFGLFMGVVFFASVALTLTMFQGRSISLWLYNTGYALIGFMIVGAIVGGWPRKAEA